MFIILAIDGPQISRSTMPTFAPFFAKIIANVEANVDFPTPLLYTNL